MNKKFCLTTILCAALLAPALHAQTGPTSPNHGRGFAKRGTLRQLVLDRFDTNHNGVLDPDERVAFRQWRKQHRQEMFARFDTNHDGRLERNERKAARKAAGKHRFHHLKNHANRLPSASPSPGPQQ